MKVRSLASILAFSIIFWAFVDRAAGDIFGSGANTFEIEFVTIGDPGNAADTVNVPNNRPHGSVDYTYQIGKYEISTEMLTKANAEGGLGIYHAGDSSVLEIWRYGPNKPAYWVSWYGAATFVNWLNESKNYLPAYKFDSDGNFLLWESGDPGYDPQNLFRNSQAKYVLPDVDEWYKAAYYDGVNDVYNLYPTGSSASPDGIDFAGDPNFDAVFNDGFEGSQANDFTDVGIPSSYGTYGQGGNLWEWEETALDYQNDSIDEYRGLNGGDFDVSSNIGDPVGNFPSEYFISKSFRTGGQPLTRGGIGIRIASLAVGLDVVPEPSSLALILVAGTGLLMRRRAPRTS